MIIQQHLEQHDLFKRYPSARQSLWSPKAFQSVDDAKSFADLVPIAIQLLEFFEEPVTIVSGPISTGGFGSRDRNIQAFTNAICYLQSRRRSVLDQTPFETALARLSRQWAETDGRQGYCMPILTEFYRPVFRSGLITTIAFMMDWGSSFGSQWEHREASVAGLKIEYLPLIEP
jgi:hypothetical protein